MASLLEGSHTEEYGEEIIEQCDNKGDDQAIKVEDVVFKKSFEVTQDESFPPKVDSEMEVLHEKVTKTWTESTMHKFEDTWKNQQPLELVLGKEKEILRGIAISMMSMQASERALFHVGGELGHGKEESFSFPNVPPMADLIYEVELIGFEESKEGKARSDMTLEERIKAANKRQQEENILFKDEKLAEAMQQYEMALPFMGDDFMFQLFGKYKDMASSIKNPCHFNMAACLLKLDHYEEAIGHYSMVLTKDKNNAKALFKCEQ